MNPTFTSPLPPLSSDLIEPHMTRVIGILWRRFQESEKTEGNYRALWEGVRTVNLLSTVCCGNGTGCHASIAANNAMRQVAEFIESEISIDPFCDWSS